MSFGARLAEERKRLGLKQAEFAALVGADAPKQSLYENDKRELRAAYLQRIAAARVDVGYVLTGRRGKDSLDEQATAVLSAYLPPDLQEAVRRLVLDLRRRFG